MRQYFTPDRWPKDSPRSGNFDAALTYAARGWLVLPLYSIDRDGRCSCGRDDCKPGKHPRTAHGVKDATTDSRQIKEWGKEWPDANIGIATGHESGFIVLDVDPRNGGKDSLAELERKIGQLPSTIEANTGGGGWHILLRHPRFPVKRSSGELGPGLDIIGEAGYIVAAPSNHISGHRYEWAKGRGPEDVELAEVPRGLLDWLRGQGRTGSQGDHAIRGNGGERIAEGQRSTTLTSIAGRLRRCGLDLAAISAALYAHNETHCDPPLPEREVEAIAKSVSRYPTDDIPAWPAPLGKEALHGLAGEIVREIEPHSEADPVAILVQLLVGVGSLLGRKANFQVERDVHYGNLFATLVGETSKGRKGVSWSHARELLTGADEDWKKCLASGLSSGEGLIHHVRDARSEKQAIRQGGRVVDYQDVMVDAGVADKRLMVFEAELSRTLRVLSRESNTLSAIIRAAWDTGDLRNLVRNSPERATGAHISVVGHITRDELLRYLNDTEMANGFANRFLWFCVQRSKVLPEGGRVPADDLDRLGKELRQVLQAVAHVGCMERDKAAAGLWREVYPRLSEGGYGLLGMITNRAEAQVMRLALLYALLDGEKETIGEVHLAAALEVWRYCADSCRYIFGTHSGDPIAEKILAALRMEPEGLTRNEVRELFSRHQPSEAIERTLKALEARGLIRPERHETTGRPSTRWLAR
jgi:hypothetical protein